MFSVDTLFICFSILFTYSIAVYINALPSAQIFLFLPLELNQNALRKTKRASTAISVVVIGEKLLCHLHLNESQQPRSSSSSSSFCFTQTCWFSSAVILSDIDITTRVWMIRNLQHLQSLNLRQVKVIFRVLLPGVASSENMEIYLLSNKNKNVPRPATPSTHPFFFSSLWCVRGAHVKLEWHAVKRTGEEMWDYFQKFSF